MIDVANLPNSTSLQFSSSEARNHTVMSNETLMSNRVAIIGAGISGLMAARTLADRGLPVTVFDKGRGVGGRMSTRRVDGQSTFDHGAQYFTARDLTFQRYVDSWLQQGTVAKWPDADRQQNIVVFKDGSRTQQSDSQQRFVGSPAMNSVCKHLAKDLEIQTKTRIQTIGRSGDAIRLTDVDGNLLGEFDRLIVSAPAAQSAELLANFPQLADPISRIPMQPCWAVMASFDQPVGDDWVAAFIHESIVTWAARNSSKPNRPTDAEHLLIHASHSWTGKNWERDPAEVAEEALAAFWESSGISPQQPIHLQAHRWKYAILDEPAATGCFYDSENGIAACGDWANGSRVEGAFLSGVAAAGRILGSLQGRDTKSANQQQLF